MTAMHKKTLILLSAVLLLIFCPGAALSQPDSPPENEQQAPEITRQIMLVVIDGLQSKALQKTRAPNINGLGSSGVKVDRVCVMPPDNTAPQVYSILSGAEPSQHGYLNRGDRPRCGTILDLMEKRGNDTALIDGTGELRGVVSGVASYYPGPYEQDREVVDIAIKEISLKKPFFTVIVLSGPARALARSGEDSGEYLKAVTEADNQVGRLLGYLHQQGFYEDTLIAVTGTRGTPPMVFKGREFRRGLLLPPVKITDLAPTLAYVQGMKLSGASGLVLWNSLEPGPGRSESYMLQQRVKDLSNAYAGAIEEAGRLEREKIAVQDEKGRLTQEKYSIEREMEKRDDEIRKLNLTIKAMKLGLALMLVLFIMALVIQFKILRKRYLFFS